MDCESWRLGLGVDDERDEMVEVKTGLRGKDRGQGCAAAEWARLLYVRPLTISARQ